MSRHQTWLDARNYTPDELALARVILDDVRAGMSVDQAVRQHPIPEGGYMGKHVLMYTYRELTDSGEWSVESGIMEALRLKPVRTLSGVTTVTVLTKKYPCPGKCIFCPTDVRMPKSYLPDEPGAMRALHHEFEPFDQTSARIEALDAIGHPTDKIELLILGATWSVYKRGYQEWFLKRCLDAMNGFEAGTLGEAQGANESADHRNVGLVIETRPDYINHKEIARLRQLGVTKVQIGAQSFDDEILERNHRGHDVGATRDAVRLLRAAGFKIVLHWMPNLLGATLESDREDFNQLWEDVDLRPDELKIYPCQLLENTDLYSYWERGEFEPYTTEELIELLAEIKTTIPRYCRVNRIIRDIPSTNIVAGNKRTSLRQDVQLDMRQRGEQCRCIRCREVRGKQLDHAHFELLELSYDAGAAEEHFLSFETLEGDLAGYLRLSLPNREELDTGLRDLHDAAIVREVHVYGQSLEVGKTHAGAVQHSGLGAKLMERAEEIAHQHGYERLGVIAALGTRGYYRKLGYDLGESYMLKDLG